MATYYTQVSFYLPCSEAERTRLVAAINDTDANESPGSDPHELEEFRRAHSHSGDPEDFSSGATAEVEADGVSIWADEVADLEVIAAAIQRFAPSALPFGFTFALSCSRPRLDAFSGGYVTITEDECRWTVAEELLSAALSVCGGGAVSTGDGRPA